MTHMTPRRIVVGVDGTAASTAAVHWAVCEARLRHTTVHLVCACHHDPSLRAHYARLPQTPDGDEREATARTCLTAAADLARRHLPPARVMTELADGLPARALLNRAAGAEMLVLGTDRPALHPAGHPPDVIGAIARACLSKAPCPVVIVAPGDFPSLPEETCIESSRRAPRQYMPAAPDGALVHG